MSDTTPEPNTVPPRDPFARSDAEALRADAALVREAAGGDPEAVERLVERLRCVPRILCALNRRRGGPLGSHDVEDLAQEAVAVILGKLGTFHGASTLEGWVHRFCFLLLMNRLRGKAREPDEPRDPDTWDVPAPPRPDPLEYEHVEESLDELGPPESDVLRLKHFEGQSFTEIAATLGISPNTAKSRYYRGLAWLQRRLAPQAGSEAGR